MPVFSHKNVFLIPDWSIAEVTALAISEFISLLVISLTVLAITLSVKLNIYVFC